MSARFADTFYFVALFQPESKEHQLAVRFSRERVGRFITTSAVLTELGNFLCSSDDRHLFTSAVEALRNRADAEIVHVDEDLFEAGYALFYERSDKDWSLTDCISFVVMERMGIRDALTADHHFEQAGFAALLKPE